METYLKHKTYQIEVSGDTDEGEAFVAWLREQGHDAKLGRTSANYVNGVDTSWDEEGNKIINALWEQWGRNA